MDFYMNYLVPGNLKDNAAKALNVYKSTDPIQFSNALWPILGDMVSTEGGATSGSVTTVLEMAANVMGSDNQLIHEPGHNNYVLDDITARLWSRLKNPVNVDQKFKEALDDIERMSFPSDDEKDAALATVYDDMALESRMTSQYAKVIAYHDAANAVGGVNHGGIQYLKCFALYKLGRFQEALEECTQLIDTYRDVALGYYYRARAHEGLKEYEAALADFAPIAEHGSDNYVRWGAVMEMEHVNALLSRYSTELEIFRTYPFVFDAELQPADDLAIAYNNRCFAYMKVGELKKALEDCEASLRYGHLPDAVHKQQELLRLLSAPSH
jgi:tetratricopeptide (TPR) repeat protein